MRFEQYLTEDKKWEFGKAEYGVMHKEFAKLVKKDCKPYLNALKGETPFRRGMRGASKSYYEGLSAGKKSVQQDRHPILFKGEAFKLANEYIEKKGGARRDKSVIGISKKPPRFFGAPYYIFPIGKLKYSWVESFDWNEENKKSGWSPDKMKYYLLGMDYEEVPITEKDIDRWIQHNKGLQVAHSRGYEIWFECKQYYFIGAEGNYAGRVLKALNLFNPLD